MKRAARSGIARYLYDLAAGRQWAHALPDRAAMQCKLLLQHNKIGAASKAERHAGLFVKHVWIEMIGLQQSDIALQADAHGLEVVALPFQDRHLGRQPPTRLETMSPLDGVIGKVA
jgi:hypothetical protein